MTKGKFWYRALAHAKDARSATYHDRIKATPHYFINGEPKNLSKFRAFGRRAYPNLNDDRREIHGWYSLVPILRDLQVFRKISCIHGMVFGMLSLVPML